MLHLEELFMMISDHTNLGRERERKENNFFEGRKEEGREKEEERGRERKHRITCTFSESCKARLCSLVGFA